jgi:hypothetical protein
MSESKNVTIIIELIFGQQHNNFIQELISELEKLSTIFLEQVTKKTGEFFRPNSSFTISPGVLQNREGNLVCVYYGEITISFTKYDDLTENYRDYIDITLVDNYWTDIFIKVTAKETNSNYNPNPLDYHNVFFGGTLS